MKEKEDEHIKEGSYEGTPFKKQLAELKNELKDEIGALRADTAYQIALDREKIKMFDDYIDLKGRGRRDFDYLSIKLKKEVSKRKRMDYVAICALFDFKSNEEAYRVMKKAIENFPLDLEVKEMKKSNRRKKVLCLR